MPRPWTRPRPPWSTSTPVFRQFFGGADNLITPRKRVETSLGSGVIMSEQGFILTNHHVIQGADAIQVSLQDGRMAQAKLVGSDPDTDVAVLKIDLKKLPVITLGHSDNLRVGDVVLAIGNPFGVGQTVTMGIVSATSSASTPSRISSRPTPRSIPEIPAARWSTPRAISSGSTPPCSPAAAVTRESDSPFPPAWPKT
jgi:S1-C subfamily serine protease